MEDQRSILKKVFGYDSFRPGQEEIVKRLLRITLYTGVYAGAELLAMPIVHGMGQALHVPMRNRRAALLLLAALLSAYAMVASPELSDRSYTCVIALTLCALATLLGDMEAHVRALDAACARCRWRCFCLFTAGIRLSGKSARMRRRGKRRFKKSKQRCRAGRTR